MEGDWAEVAFHSLNQSKRVFLLELDTTGIYALRAEEQLAQAVEWFDLAPRHRDIVWAIWDGLTTREEIAERLGIGVATVKTHLISLYEHLGASSILGVMLILFGRIGTSG